MEISFIGHSCFRIKGKDTTLVIDPYDPKMTGFKLPKLKADIVNRTQGYVIDLKTTSDIDKFSYSARVYNYDSQAYIYSTYFEMDFLFIVVCKKSKKIGIFDCSPQFLESGKDKVQRAVEQYRLFYKDENFDPAQYFISKTL